MRGSRVSKPADRFSRTVTLTAWGLVGLFFSFAALPLAFSSPYPTPSRQDWSIGRTAVQAQMELASAAAAPALGMELASASSTPVVLSAPATNKVRTLSIKRPEGYEQEADAPIVVASIGPMPTVKSRSQPPGLKAKAPLAPAAEDEDDDARATEAPAPAARGKATDMAEVDRYLFEVYSRSPVKKDRSGDFTWKDPAAAKRVGMTLQSYVIVGMDADFREQIYHAGRAMDAAGIEWTIVSGFRDDWRQSIAAGIKARAGYSRHGGSRAVGGYGHGRAVDVGHVEPEKSHIVFRWIDENGARYGLHRPIRHFDPPHVEPRHDWRRIAARLKRERLGTAVAANESAEEARPANTKAPRSRWGRYN